MIKYVKTSNARAGALLIKKINGEPNILIVKQWNGIYSVPKGSVEKGETNKQAAQRELREETGLNFNIHTFTNKVNIFGNEFWIFNCDKMKLDFKIDNVEITQIMWTPMYKLKNINTNSFLKRIYFKRKYFEYKSNEATKAQ